MSEYTSWGRFPRVSQKARFVHWPGALDLPAQAETVLPYGLGRSYGDCCLNGGASILVTQGLNRFIAFDAQSGVLRCEAGVSLAEILRVFVPRGWFLPVTPGTKFVTVGGAIANDVHGKNHHRAGTFGRHVLGFSLLRSDGRRVICTPAKEAELFSATIGGLGLTGLIEWAEIQLKPVKSAFIEMESVKCAGLDEFFEVSGSSDRDFEYTVAWIDCLARGSAMGRAIFMRGNHAEAPGGRKLRTPRESLFTVPFDFPALALNRLSIGLFNTLYYNKQRRKIVKSLVHYNPFFYPLDAVLEWNRIYGKRGFLQYQCVVPQDGNNAAIRRVLGAIVDSGRASFLAVIKEFGSIKSPGMLSFPRPGVTICLDFPFQGQATMELFARLDRMVCEAGGAMYPAKDACMSAESFAKYYPRLEEFRRYVDPRFSSSFWRRVTGEGGR